jgi:hypothetical protein
LCVGAGAYGRGIRETYDDVQQHEFRSEVGPEVGYSYSGATAT